MSYANYGRTMNAGYPCDYNFMRYVGWDESNACIARLYSSETTDLISKKVTELTIGIDPKNRNILVSRNVICQVLDSVYSSYKMPVGDIITRYHIPNNEQDDAVQAVIDRTIEILVSSIRDQYGINDANQKLSAWVQLYGDFNQSGLRQYAPIKIKGKRADRNQFNMKY
jgi:hypothetical protein